jgi:hypothetical protein
MPVLAVAGALLDAGGESLVADGELPGANGWLLVASG